MIVAGGRTPPMRRDVISDEAVGLGIDVAGAGRELRDQFLGGRR